MSRYSFSYTHGDAGTAPGSALDFQANERPEAQHFDWFWSTVIAAINGHSSEFTRLDANDDGIVDEADYANDADASTYKGSDIDSNGDGKVNAADNADNLGGNAPGYYATDSALSSHESDTTNPHSVTAAQAGALADSADVVTAFYLASGAVGSAELGTDAVTNAKIAANAVGSTEIAADAVGSAEIANGSVDTAKLATDAVTNAKIAANAVGTTQLNFDPATQSELNSHTGDTTNPHSVTAAQVGASPTGHTHDGRYYTEAETRSWVNNNADVPNADYADSAGNADTVDGQHASDFATSADLQWDYVKTASTSYLADNSLWEFTVPDYDLYKIFLGMSDSASIGVNGTMGSDYYDSRNTSGSGRSEDYRGWGSHAHAVWTFNQAPDGTVWGSQEPESGSSISYETSFTPTNIDSFHIYSTYGELSNGVKAEVYGKNTGP